MMRSQRQRILGLAAAAGALAGLSAVAGAQTIIGPFTGGDAGEGLDTSGNFVYAIDVGGPGGQTVGNATFTNGQVGGPGTPGATIVAPNEIPGWHAPAYGASANDDALESVVASIRWNQGPVTVDLTGLQAGQPYRLQLLYAESCCDRGFDVFVEGAEIAPDFNVQQNQGGINNTAQGVVITHDFVAGDDTLNILQQGPAPYPDNNPILNGLTLELVPEPGSLGLLAFAGVGMLARRRPAR